MSATFLSVARDQRVVLLGLGLAGVGLALVMRSLLEHVREEAEVKPVQPKPQYITQETEDSLKLSTLDTLLSHYNYAIRETSAKIVCDRAVNDSDTVDILLWGITQPDYDERMKNLRCLVIITDHHSLGRLHEMKAYRAFVRCLELCISDGGAEYRREKLNDKYYDDYFLRDMSEKLCLMFVGQLINRYTANELLVARFVEKWLAKQYWGDTDEEILANFAQYMQRKQNRITEIISRIQELRMGRRVLIKAKLVPQKKLARRRAKPLTPPTGLRVINNATGEVDEHTHVEHAEQVVPRVLGQSAEEQRLRHRHREAFVFNNGSHPLNRDDIIERPAGSPG